MMGNITPEELREYERKLLDEKDSLLMHMEKYGTRMEYLMALYRILGQLDLISILLSDMEFKDMVDETHEVLKDVG